jgi:nitronate monooxygenase
VVPQLDLTTAPGARLAAGARSRLPPFMHYELTPRAGIPPMAVIPGKYPLATARCAMRPADFRGNLRNMAEPLKGLARCPVVVAPMAGGSSVPGLVIAAAAAGALGFLAAGYKTAAAMRAEMAAVRAAGVPFGVNVFVPGEPAPDRAALARYLAELEPDAAALGARPGVPDWNDDDWDAKLAALIAAPPAVVSFTFGCPQPGVLAALRSAGSQVWVTVTAPEEAALAAESGAGALCVQGPEAGAHRGTFSAAANPPGVPLHQLLRDVAAVTGLPLIAAGAIMGHGDVQGALAAGAVAVQCGTAFLRCPESDTNPVHRAALTDPAFTATAVTRAFTGRPARGLVNQFMLDHQDAPPAYPEVHCATRPLRAAATAAGDAGRINLWAGEGYRAATSRPAAGVVALLAGG